MLTAYVAGQAAAFEELVRRHGRMVHGVCRRVLGNADDADDAFQAVFMVLARKAGSLTQRESVAGWLYGVACRTAKKARVSATRRRRREQVVATMTREEISDTATDADVGPCLDEEVNRLPEKYRLPVLLCYLEGESNEDAARRHALLGRCGQDASAAGSRTAAEPARTAWSDGVRRRTRNAPRRSGGDGVHAGAARGFDPQGCDKRSRPVRRPAPTGAAALAQGVIRDMYLAKLKWIAVVVLGLGTLGVGVGHGRAGPRTAAAQAPTGEQLAMADTAKPAPAEATAGQGRRGRR